MANPRFPILFVTSSRVGDAVLSSGLIRRLLDEIPHARFTIVAGPLAAPMFRDTPGLDRLIALEKGPAGLHWLSLWRQVRGRRWGLIVDMRGSGLARFLSARRRAVRRSPPASFEPTHKVIEAARVLRVEDDPPAPFLFTNAATEETAASLLGDGGPILAVAPATNWAGKTWPPERFAVVAAELLGRSGPMPTGRLLLLGGPDDRFAAEAVRRVIPRARLIDTVGRIDLLTAYACLRRARLFIGNDSGLMHLAAAAGAPTLGLFGPSDDRLYGPWGARARVLRGPRDFETFKKIDPELNQVVCHMFDLPTPWVVNAAKRLFEDTAADFPPPPPPPPEPEIAAPETPVGEAPRTDAAGPEAAEAEPAEKEEPDAVELPSTSSESVDQPEPVEGQADAGAPGTGGPPASPAPDPEVSAPADPDPRPSAFAPRPTPPRKPPARPTADPAAPKTAKPRARKAKAAAPPAPAEPDAS